MAEEPGWRGCLPLSRRPECEWRAAKSVLAGYKNSTLYQKLTKRKGSFPSALFPTSSLIKRKEAEVGWGTGREEVDEGK